jgi:hypothetical protein
MGSMTRNTVFRRGQTMVIGKHADEPNGRLRLISATCENDFGWFKS